MLTKHDAEPNAVNEVNLGDLRDENKARWIRVSVDMLEHDAFAGEPFSRRDAWLWLIANAAWKPRRFKVANVNGMIELQRGQTLAARGYLADRWQWGEKKVRLFLEFLQSENMIEMGQSKGRFANVVTICNYEKYQNAPENKGQLEGRLEASSGPVEGQTLTKNTNTTNLETTISVTGDAAREAALPSVDDLKTLQAKLVAAALPGLVDEANRQGMIAIPEPLGWIKAGANLEIDILPTLAKVAAKAAAKGTKISTWGYFNKPVAEAVAARKSGAQIVEAAAAKAKPASTFFHPPKRSPEQEEREREAWARQMGVIDEHVH